METSVTNTTWGEEAILLGFSQKGGILTVYFRFQECYIRSYLVLIVLRANLVL